MEGVEDLNDALLREFQLLIETTIGELERSLAASAADAKPVDLGLSIGRLSRVDALAQQRMAIARQQRGQQQIQQLRAALGRVLAKTYGVCLRCGESISLARLRVKPEATLCRECQSAGPT